MTLTRRLIDRAARPFATAAALLQRRLRRGAETRSSGAHSIALTPAGRVILVRLRYAEGWRLPGGGCGDDESLAEGALRELREEIGLHAHGRVRPLPEIHRSLILVEDVAYSPKRWSWEIERVIEVDPDDLPRDMSRAARQWIAAARRLI